MGSSYLPAWGFSAIDNLEFGEGYQIKMIEEVLDFQFCAVISQEKLDAAIAEVHAMKEGGANQIDNDGICDEDEASGCIDAASCNYESTAEFDDGSCEYESCSDQCGVPNGDNSSCADECGVPNGIIRLVQMSVEFLMEITHLVLMNVVFLMGITLHAQMSVEF